MRGNTVFVTCIYNNLYGTELGGRNNRQHHYFHSLNNIIKKTPNSDFIIYTSPDEYEDIKLSFPYNNCKIQQYDLNNNYFQKEFDKYKDRKSAQTSDRCFEIQYSKFYWMYLALYDENIYKNIYWIDAGLSYSGLIPDKYLECKGLSWGGDDYYKSELFNDKFTSNLNKFTKSKILFIAKENMKNFWSQEMVEYMDYDQQHHIIGGLFGGRRSKVLSMTAGLIPLIKAKINEEKTIQWSEEQFMTLYYYLNKSRARIKTFDTWWHENNYANAEEIPSDIYFSDKKSFYNILEELQ